MTVNSVAEGYRSKSAHRLCTLLRRIAATNSPGQYVRPKPTNLKSIFAADQSAQVAWYFFEGKFKKLDYLFDLRKFNCYWLLILSALVVLLLFPLKKKEGKFENSLLLDFHVLFFFFKKIKFKNLLFEVTCYCYM